MQRNWILPFQFLYRRCLRPCGALLALSHSLQVALGRGMGGRLDQLDFSAAFYIVSHYGLLYKLMSIDVGGPFLPIVSKFLSYRRQRVRLNGKVSTSVDRVSGVPPG